MHVDNEDKLDVLHKSHSKLLSIEKHLLLHDYDHKELRPYTVSF